MHPSQTADQPAVASPAATATWPSTRFLFWGGALLLVASVVAYVVQINWANLLVTPWYMPVGGTLAAIMVVWAFARQRRWWQAVVALACITMAVLEWLFVTTVSALPPYSGPELVGSSVPQFQATLADGKAIDESYLAQGRPSVVVFFQGRWCPFCMTQLRDLEANHEAFAAVGSNVVVVSIEDMNDAAATQRDFPHLTIVSDEKRTLAGTLDSINPNFGPDGKDAAIPTVLLVDGKGIIQWFDRPAQFIARPSALELARRIGDK